MNKDDQESANEHKGTNDQIPANIHLKDIAGLYAISELKDLSQQMQEHLKNLNHE